nr:hypothetical protein [Tanacetum cinerariifolium]
MEAGATTTMTVKPPILNPGEYDLWLMRIEQYFLMSDYSLWEAELETISLDDLYNNLKIYEPELLGSSNTNQNPQNMDFVSSNSTSNTNEAATTASGVSTAHTQGTTVNSTSVDNFVML